MILSKMYFIVRSAKRCVTAEWIAKDKVTFIKPWSRSAEAAR